MSDLMTDKQMEELPAISQAASAIGHTLNQICTEPTIGYLMGPGGQCFALLTEAFATIHCMDVAKVREEFMPKAAKDPRETYGPSPVNSINSYGEGAEMPGGCPCCGGGNVREYDKLREDLEDLVAQFATDVLICTPHLASDEQLITALREKLNQQTKG